MSVLTLGASEQHGIVRFSGLPVPGATVTATQNDKKVVVVTGEDGFYSFPNLADGTWTMDVEMLCFAPLKEDVTVAPNAPAHEWELKLLPLDQIKAVAAAAPPPPPLSTPAETSSAAPIQPDKPAAKPPAAAKKGKKLPPAANTSSAFQRATLTASANAAPAPADNAPPPVPGDLNQSASDSLAINGSQNNGSASPFSQSGAFGNNRRGFGSLYNGTFALRETNSSLDARNYSLTGLDSPKPQQNQLGFSGTFGGPLRIPHLIRTVNSAPTFSVTYQLNRQGSATTMPWLMPTAQQRAGDFAQTIVDPSTGLPFPGNVIPPSRISPQATSLLSFYPLPNLVAGSSYNYQNPLTSSSNSDAVNARLSKRINRNQVFGTFSFQDTRAESTNVFAFHDTNGSRGIDTTVNWLHPFTQRMFTTLRVEFNRLSTRSTPYFAERENVSGEAGITGNNQDPLNWGPPSLTFSSGIASLSDAQQSFNREQTTSISDSTSWIRSPHNFTFGGDFRRQQINNLAQQNARGTFGFTSAPGATVTGSDFADFLLGVPATSSVAFGNADKYLRDSIYDAYVNDDWRASPSLTVNAGVRWDYGSPITELYGRLVNLDVMNNFAAVAPLLGGNPVGSLTGQHYPSSLVRPDKHEFSPRIGIAWRPISGSSLVVRAGYGVNYNTSAYQSIAAQMDQQAPLSTSLTVSNSTTPLTLARGFVALPGAAGPVFGVDPNFRVGYVQTWQASVQRDLPAAMIMTATYLGNKGTRGVEEFYPNTYPTGPVGPAGYAYMTSNGNSTREAGQIQLRRRLHNGFTATVQYVYSKSIDDASLGGRGQGAALVAQNWLDLRAERGLSSFDQRHLLTLQMQYTTGVGIGGGTLLDGWRGRLAKEWTFTNQITLGSGLPLTPVYPGIIPGTGFYGLRPDYTGASLYDATGGLFLNPLAYTKPQTGEWGNAGRNSIEGPDVFTMNASMARTFRLRDRLNMDLSFNSSNVLNHVTFPSWNTTIGSPQFGLPGTANAMRTVTANVRVRF